PAMIADVQNVAAADVDEIVDPGGGECSGDPGSMKADRAGITIELCHASALELFVSSEHRSRGVPQANRLAIAAEVVTSLASDPIGDRCDRASRPKVVSLNGVRRRNIIGADVERFAFGSDVEQPAGFAIGSRNLQRYAQGLGASMQLGSLLSRSCE